MPSPDPSPSIDSAAPENLVETGSYANADDGFQHALVVLAMGRACWLVPDANVYRLMVEAGGIDAIQQQLRSFDRESVGWPPTPTETVPHRPLHLFTPLLWAVAILAVFWGETFDSRWLELGALDREAVFARHEWWRTFTALFLHADVGHLLSNALSGFFVFSVVVTLFGRLRGWLALVAASVLGNALTVTVNYEVAYRSIGASTAVFAAVGMLTGRAMRQMGGMPRSYRWRAMFPPFASGITVLALYGAGGVHIDVGAHCAGFLMGFVAGLILASPRHRDVPPRA